MFEVQGRHRGEQIGNKENTGKEASMLLGAEVLKADPLQACWASIPQRKKKRSVRGGNDREYHSFVSTWYPSFRMKREAYPGSNASTLVAFWGLER